MVVNLDGGVDRGAGGVECRDRAAARCFRKGRFWADPDSWSLQDIESADISLDKLELQLKATLEQMCQE